MPRLLMLSYLLVLCACVADDKPEYEIVQRDSAGTYITELRNLDRDVLPEWRLAEQPDLSIGATDGAAGHDLFGVRMASRSAAGRIAIADASQQIRIYDSDGNLIRTLGRRGAGPGEFQALSWTGWRGDSVLGYDPGFRRLTVFHDGELKREMSLPLPGTPSFPEVVGVLANGSVAAYPGFDRRFGRGERRDTVAYLIYSADGTRLDTLGHYAGLERFFVQTPEMAMQREVLFGRDTHAATGAEVVVIGASDTLAFDVYDDGGRLRRRIRIEADARPVTRNDEAALRAELAAGATGPMGAMVERSMQDLPARASYPAFTALAVDAAQRFWVRDAVAPGAVTAQWLVLAGDGTPTARVSTPAGLKMHEVGIDHVLAGRRNNDGVEIVELYRIRR